MSLVVIISLMFKNKVSFFISAKVFYVGFLFVVKKNKSFEYVNVHSYLYALADHTLFASA